MYLKFRIRLRENSAELLCTQDDDVLSVEDIILCGFQSKYDNISIDPKKTQVHYYLRFFCIDSRCKDFFSSTPRREKSTSSESMTCFIDNEMAVKVGIRNIRFDGNENYEKIS